MKILTLKRVLIVCLVVLTVSSAYYLFHQHDPSEITDDVDDKASSRQRFKKSASDLRLSSPQKMELNQAPRNKALMNTRKTENKDGQDRLKGFDDYKNSADRLIAGGKTQEAIQVLENALSESPDDPRLQTEVAFAYIQNDQIDRAKQVFEKKIAEDPNDPEAHLGLGVIDRLNGNVDSALGKFNEALQLDPDNSDAKYNMAEVLTYERGQNGTSAEKFLAEKYYQDLLRDSPNHPDLQNGIASVYLATGRTDQAITVWEKTVRENPNDSTLLSNLSEAYLGANRADEAILNSQKALEQDPNNSDAYFFLGNAEIAKGNQQQGLEAIRKAIGIEPDNLGYQKKLRELAGQ